MGTPDRKPNTCAAFLRNSAQALTSGAAAAQARISTPGARADLGGVNRRYQPRTVLSYEKCAHRCRMARDAKSNTEQHHARGRD